MNLPSIDIKYTKIPIIFSKMQFMQYYALNADWSKLKSTTPNIC